MCDDESPFCYRSLCLPVPVGVGGAPMALVGSRWGRGDVRRENELERLASRGRDTSPVGRVLNAPSPPSRIISTEFFFRVYRYSRGRNSADTSFDPL